MNTFLDDGKIFRYISDIKGIIHIGAHDGFEAQIYWPYVKDKVVWFEADPQIFEELQRNVAKFGQIPILAALWDREQPHDWWMTKNTPASSLLKPTTKYSDLYENDGEILEHKILNTRRFDTLWTELNLEISDYNICVIDTQGAEREVICGMGIYKNSFDIIECEYTSEHLGHDLYEGQIFLDELIELLGEYKMIYPQEQDRQIHDNALFVHRRLIK